MKKRIIRFDRVENLPNGNHDRLYFVFPYEIMDEERNVIKSNRIKTIITGSLASCWGYGSMQPEKFDDLGKILHQYIKIRINDGMQKKDLEDYEEIVFDDQRYGQDRPYNPDELDEVLNYEFEVEIYDEIPEGLD